MKRLNEFNRSGKSPSTARHGTAPVFIADVNAQQINATASGIYFIIKAPTKPRPLKTLQCVLIYSQYNNISMFLI